MQKKIPHRNRYYTETEGKCGLQLLSKELDSGD